jgi:hypothetical protein
VLRQADELQLAVPRCRLPFLKERGRGLSEHELGLKRARYNKEKARKKAHNQEKKRREDKGETVSPNTSDMPSFSQFERSSTDSSEGDVGGDSSDGDGGDDPPVEGPVHHGEHPDAQEPVDSPDAASSASDPSDPKGK